MAEGLHWQLLLQPQSPACWGERATQGPPDFLATLFTGMDCSAGATGSPDICEAAWT